jgi:hypothetical protein
MRWVDLGQTKGSTRQWFSLLLARETQLQTGPGISVLSVSITFFLNRKNRTVPAAGPWLATNLAEAGGEGDGLLGGGELCGVGVPRRHGADCEETRRRAAGAGGGDGGGDAAAVARDGWRRIGEASTGRGESSGGGDEERVREEEAHARSHVVRALPAACVERD